MTDAVKARHGGPALRRTSLGQRIRRGFGWVVVAWLTVPFAVAVARIVGPAVLAIAAGILLVAYGLGAEGRPGGER